MTGSANVRSLQAIRDFRSALVTFGEDARSAVESLRAELHRTLQWIDVERPAYWRGESRQGFEAVASARSELAKKKVIAAGSHRPFCYEEKLALDRAKQRLQTAMDKRKAVEQWAVKVHRAADRYSTRIARFDRLLNHELPKVAGRLDRMIRALEAYTTTAAGPSVVAVRDRKENIDTAATESASDSIPKAL
ncbi:MAG: hypothetical protein IID45_04215 [Planctomycetes bacterium]|nr:hypothetical protein [Planctomycetota bacterium]